MLLKIAWRNVWRNARRSAITLAASSFGLATLIVVFAISDGIHEQIINNATQTSLGHMQIFAAGYREDPTLEKSIENAADVIGILEKDGGWKHLLPRVQGSGLISSAENSIGVMILGVEPGKERAATRIPKAIDEGTYFENTEGKVGQIVIGRQLAKRLKIRLGEKLVLLGQAADGSLASELFRVEGIFKTGSEPIDLGIAFIRLERAQEFFVLGEGLTSLLVFLDDLSAVPGTKERFESSLSGAGVEILTWGELDPGLLQVIQLDDASIFILLLIVFFIVALGIVNTLLMSVFERTREFGVLLAMGMEPRTIVAMISLESLALGAVSLIFGSIVGVLVGFYIQSYGIDLTRWTQGVTLSSGFFEPILYAKVRAAAILKSCVAVIIITWLSGLYPAFKASHLLPVEALRHS